MLQQKFLSLLIILTMGMGKLLLFDFSETDDWSN